MGYLPYCQIDGIDVTAYLLDFENEDTNEVEPAVVSIKFTNAIENDINLQQEMEIILERGFTTQNDHRIFRGYVTRVAKEGHLIKLTAADKLVKLQRQLITKTFDKDIDTEAGVGSEIAKTIIEGAGLTASVVSTGSSVLIAKLICKDDPRLERLKRIAEVYQYQLRYDPSDDTVYFEPKGNTTYTHGALEVGTNVVNIPQWQYDFEDMANYVVVKGAMQEAETTESGQIGVDSGYTTASITLTQEPVSVKVFADSSNPPTTLRKGGIVGSTQSPEYSVDRENKKVIWNTTVYTPGGSDYVEVRYSYKEPRTVIAKDQDSIDKYGQYQVEKKFRDVKDMDDGLERARGILSLKPTPPIFTRFDVVGVTALKAGMTVQAIDATNNEDRQMIVNKIIRRFPECVDEVRMGDREYNDRRALVNINERLRALEKEQEKEQDVVVQLLEFDTPFEVQRRYQKLKRHKIFDSFILNHSVNGLLNMGTILDDFESSNSSNWSGGSVTIGDDATNVQVKSGSMSVVWSATGSVTFSSTQSHGDLSTYTGAASGMPAQGTIGVWWKSSSTTDISAMKLRIGSSASDYIECSAREYRTADGYDNFDSGLSFDLFEGWNYFLFDLDNPDTVSGTPDWTAVDYVRFEITAAATGTAYMDYFTISKSNYIGLNGLGDRTIEFETAYVVQGNHVFREYVTDSEFVDSSSATINTTDNRIEF